MSSLSNQNCVQFRSAQEGCDVQAKWRHVNQTPAGWYPDPEQIGTQRYWDGANWTEQRAPFAAPAVLSPPPTAFSPPVHTPSMVPPAKKGCLKPVLIGLGVVVLLGAIGAATSKKKAAVVTTQLRAVGVTSAESTVFVEPVVAETIPLVETTVVDTSVVDTSVVVDTTVPGIQETRSQENAREKANDYLTSGAFSKNGLVKQLEFEGFSNADAVYGVGAVEVEWKEQAVKKAAEYLTTGAFSKAGLIKQLNFEGFTAEEANFGVEAKPVDWNEEAAKKAAEYLSSGSFSKQSLTTQLQFEGFTPSEATYGVGTTGL
jgi:Host cell surface-exposed lipoprotein/Protein of unknown function (DUF2510)